MFNKLRIKASKVGLGKDKEKSRKSSLDSELLTLPKTTSRKGSNFGLKVVQLTEKLTRTELEDPSSHDPFELSPYPLLTVEPFQLVQYQNFSFELIEKLGIKGSEHSRVLKEEFFLEIDEITGISGKENLEILFNDSLERLRLGLMDWWYLNQCSPDQVDINNQTGFKLFKVITDHLFYLNLFSYLIDNNLTTQDSQFECDWKLPFTLSNKSNSSRTIKFSDLSQQTYVVKLCLANLMLSWATNSHGIDSVNKVKARYDKAATLFQVLSRNSPFNDKIFQIDGRLALFLSRLSRHHLALLHYQHLPTNPTQPKISALATSIEWLNLAQTIELSNPILTQYVNTVPPVLDSIRYMLLAIQADSEHQKISCSYISYSKSKLKKVLAGDGGWEGGRRLAEKHIKYIRYLKDQYAKLYLAVAEWDQGSDDDTTSTSPPNSTPKYPLQDPPIPSNFSTLFQIPNPDPLIARITTNSDNLKYPLQGSYY